MAKVPKFMQAMLSSNKKQSDRVREKLQGIATLDMVDPTLQWAVGGWIRGRDNLIFGPAGSGKTALALLAAGQEQKLSGGIVVIFDSEYSHKDPHDVDDYGNPTEDAVAARLRLTQAGLDWKRVVLKQSNQIDVLFENLEQIKADLKEDPSFLSAIIVDSWGGIQSESSQKAVSKGELGKAGNQFGGTAKLMTPILQELLRLAAEHAILCLFVQHCMISLDEYAPNKYILLGGEKLKFLCHNIIFVESIKAKDASLLEGTVATTKETVNADIVYRIGKKIRVICEKSRVVTEGRRGEFWFDFKELKFALPETSLFNLAERLGVIAHPATPQFEDDGVTPKVDKKTGMQVTKTNNMMWEYPVGSHTPGKWRGESGMIAALKDDKDLYKRIYADCMRSGKTDAGTDEASEAEVSAAATKKKGKK
jgi:RecA/RadA recombinase